MVELLPGHFLPLRIFLSTSGHSYASEADFCDLLDELFDLIIFFPLTDFDVILPLLSFAANLIGVFP